MNLIRSVTRAELGLQTFCDIATSNNPTTYQNFGETLKYKKMCGLWSQSGVSKQMLAVTSNTTIDYF